MKTIAQVMNYETQAPIADIHEALKSLGFNMVLLDAQTRPVRGGVYTFGEIVYRKDKQRISVLKTNKTFSSIPFYCYLICEGEDEQTKEALLRFSKPTEKIW